MRKTGCISLFVFFCLFWMDIVSYAQRDSTTPDTLCRLVSFSDTIYVTDADAHYTIDRYRRDCWGNSEKKLDRPLYILHIKGELCGKFSTLVCQSADYYDSGNRRWIPMKRLKTVGARQRTSRWSLRIASCCFSLRNDQYRVVEVHC